MFGFRASSLDCAANNDAGTGKIVYELYLNDEPVTEAAFNGAVAGHFGVPVGLVSGDDALLDEVAGTHPWAERVITQWAMADVEAVRGGLADGTIDAIATDHAPHAPDTKEQPLDQAPPGMLGLETALGVCLAHLEMPIADVVGSLSWKPARIAGNDTRHGRPVRSGEPANLTIFDPTEDWEVVPARLASRSRNTPYVGVPLRGRVKHTLLDGVPVVEQGRATR